MKTATLNARSAFTQLPPLHYLPTGDNPWGWHDINELCSCIAQILMAQGCKKSTLTVDELKSFAPTNQSFTWVTHWSTETVMEMETGTFDECPIGLTSKHDGLRIFVPAGWGIGVAKTIKEFGVVEITHFNPSGTAWGRRWNGELFNLAKHDQFWRR